MSPGRTARAPATAAAAPAGGAERRLVTVLFADLVGFTPFAEERDAEDVRDTLSRYFDLCSDIVGRYGGTIEKFIGDAVMAVWGAPTAHEDDAERAVRAALELIDAVTALAPGIQARAGLLTGEAAVTIGATNQGMVAGDLVNTASRLQSVAPPSTVLVGESTYRATNDAIAFEEAGGQVLKGKAAPVAAWRALRVVAERGGRNRSEGLEAPFVGRADELRQLKDLFHATGRDRRARLVSVMGPAGIGKSRLAWEFLKYVDGLVEDAYWHSGRSPAYGEGISFWALGEMIRGRCALLESDDETTTRQKVADSVARWMPVDDERKWVERALLTLLGFESGMGPEQLFGAWRTFFERISEHGTVVIAFEDLHHADSGTLDFIDHLLDWSRGFPLFIVTLARPELLDRRPNWGAGKRNFTSTLLEPLSEPQMRDLLAGLVPGLPGLAVASIIRRADGVPLYAVETVRMLLAAGRLREEAGTYIPVGDLASLAVPETLTALISSRLDSVDAADRSLVHDAAVLGQSFTVAALSSVSGVSEDELHARLTGLVRRELLAREADLRSPELGQFIFVQALIREVAYNTLSRKDRMTRHLAAARYFEQLGSEELAGALAGHYLAAHANAGGVPEAGALAAQARLALTAAAERAAALGAHDEAITFFVQALSVTADAPGQADLLEKAGGSANIAARYDKAEEFHRHAVELHLQVGNRKGAARATSALGVDMLRARHVAAALETLQKAAAEYADLWPDAVMVKLKIQLARAYTTAEQHRRSVELTDEALDVAEHDNLLPLLAEALITKGRALGSLGRLREAVALVAAGESLSRDNDQTEALLDALAQAGYSLLEVDQVAALEKFREGLALARRTGRRDEMLHFLNNVGYTAFLTGEWDEALAVLDEGLAEDLEPGWHTWLLSNALILRANRGEPVAGGLAELGQLTSVHGDPDLVLPTLDANANAALADGRIADARDSWGRSAELSASQAPSSLYQRARGAIWLGQAAEVRSDLDALDATGFHGGVVEVRRLTLRAALAAMEGQTTEALGLYRHALTSWHELGMAWDEALTGMDMATVLDATDPDVAGAVKTTREILTRLDARPYLARLESVLARGTRPSDAAPATPPKVLAPDSAQVA
jgi:class 3 adenylate cyclase/tetratricopeptide (TPR) repeat protein